MNKIYTDADKQLIVYESKYGSHKAFETYSNTWEGTHIFCKSNGLQDLMDEDKGSLPISIKANELTIGPCTFTMIRITPYDDDDGGIIEVGTFYIDKLVLLTNEIR